MITEQIKQAPNCAGIYKFLDKKSQIIYIGKAKNLRKRLSSYLDSKKISGKTKRMMSLAVRFETISTASEVEALILECNLIKKFQPRYNVIFRDGKTFPYILISKNHDFARITKYRGEKTKREGRYFGPFTNTRDVNLTIDILRKIFRLRNCSDGEFARRKKPCLEYQIKRCAAPCVGLVDKQDYDELMSGALNFLAGKNSQIQKKLQQKMRSASKNKDYEKAAIYRDQISALCAISGNNKNNTKNGFS